MNEYTINIKQEQQQTRFCLDKIINFYVLLSPFHCAKLKKNHCNRSKVTWIHPFWAQNVPFAPNKIFQRKNH